VIDLCTFVFITHPPRLARSARTLISLPIADAAYGILPGNRPASASAAICDQSSETRNVSIGWRAIFTEDNYRRTIAELA